MQRLEVSGAVRPIYGSLGVKRLIYYDSTNKFVASVYCTLPFTDSKLLSPEAYDEKHCKSKVFRH